MNEPAAHTVIAIDGPAASGKSSVAKALAQRLGFVYVNSGAVYRAVTWFMLERGVKVQEAGRVATALAELVLECGLDGSESMIRINGVDPTPHLRGEAINGAVSNVSAVPEVRKLLMEKLRAYADQDDLVMEGRDIGSVVFPQTPHKFYVDASPEVRAQRRASQGQNDEIAARDQFDSSRRSAPLILANDAVVVDSSHLSIVEVVEVILGKLEEKGLAAPR